MRFRSINDGQTAAPLTPLMITGFIAGILTGLMGIGGGVLWLPVLVHLMGLPVAKAAGASLVLVWVAALGAAALHFRDGNISPALWAVMLVGGLLGALLGTKLGLRLADAKLRQYFVWVVFSTIIMVVCQLVQLWISSHDGAAAS